MRIRYTDFQYLLSCNLATSVHQGEGNNLPLTNERINAEGLKGDVRMLQLKPTHQPLETHRSNRR